MEGEAENALDGGSYRGLELNLESFRLSGHQKEDLAAVFCAAKELLNGFGHDVLYEEISFWLRWEMTEKEFSYLRNFLMDIGVFQPGAFIEIDPECEFLIRTELAD